MLKHEYKIILLQNTILNNKLVLTQTTSIWKHLIFNLFYVFKLSGSDLLKLSENVRFGFAWLLRNNVIFKIIFWW